MGENLSERLSSQLIAFTEDREFLKSFYLIFLSFGIIMYSWAGIGNYLVGLSWITVIIPFVSVLLMLLWHFMFYRSGKINLCLLLGIITNDFLFSPLTWLTNLGLKGGFQYHVFLFMVITIVILKGKSRIIVSIAYLVEIVALMLFEAQNPEIIRQLSGTDFNVVDSMFSFFASMCGIAITLLTLSVLFKNEQRKILELSTLDPLTKQYNRRFIINMINNLYKNPENPDLNGKFAVFMDVDDFKTINDQYGHNEGDRLLFNICQTIRDNIRKSDYLARMGGDEFLLLMDSESPETAEAFTKRIAEAVKSENNITISAGLTALSGKMNSDELIETVDSMMYNAKKSGKNQIFVSERD